MTLYEVLTKAQDLIRDPKHWTKGSFAINKNGNRVDPSSDKAFCFCMVGAIYRTGSDRNKESEAINVLSTQTTGGAILVFNDSPTTSHEEVMSAFDRAREMALQEKQA